MNTYHTGFAMTIDATLLVNGAAIDPSALTVTAALVAPGRVLAPGSTVVTCTKPGGTTVRASWTAAQTALITPGQYLIEFRTNDGPYCHAGQPIALLAGVAP
jgi:hypothetical protein